MQNQSNPGFNQETDWETLQCGGSLRDVLAWIQEHTNLCMVVACTGGFESEQSARLKEKVRSSLDRGKRLVSAAANADGAVSPFSESIASPAHAIVRRPSNAIPLSGVRRFDDSALAGAAAPSVQPVSFTPATALQRPSINPAANPRTLPLPSRTYLKKSGT